MSEINDPVERADAGRPRYDTDERRPVAWVVKWQFWKQSHFGTPSPEVHSYLFESCEVAQAFRGGLPQDATSWIAAVYIGAVKP